MTATKNPSGFAAPACLAAALGVALPIPATAQIQEIIVETRRRAESLQEVPIAVSAITSEQIERQGISDLKDIVQNQPSVQFDQAFGPADNRITIRGLSNTRGRSNVAFLIDGIDVTTENLVSAGSGLLANRRLLTDVERIEIVKGPQSALYGRAAFAGAISYITKEPGDEFDGRVNIDVGDYGRRIVDAAFGGPLTDTFGVRLTGVHFNEDGYYKNSMSGEQLGGSSGYGTAFTALWRPDDMVKIKARVEYSDEKYDPRAVTHIQGDTPFFLTGDAANAKFLVRPIITGLEERDGQQYYTTERAASSATNLFNFGTYCPPLGFSLDAINSGEAGDPAFCLPRIIKNSKGLVIAHSEDPLTGRDYPGTETETFRASLIASFDLGYGLFSSYTGWTDFSSLDRYDQDYQASTALDQNGNGPLPYVYAADGSVISGRRDSLLSHQESNQETDTKQFSQEFRFETQWDGPLKFTGGALFWQDDRKLADRNWITFCSPYSRVAAEELFIDGIPVRQVRSATGELINPNPPPGQLPGILVRDSTTGVLVQAPGTCDGSNFTVTRPPPLPPLATPTLTAWQDLRRQIPEPRYFGQWRAQTRHLSFYARLDWDVTDDLTLSIEDRFVDEDFTLAKPGATVCTRPAFANNGQPTVAWTEAERTWCDAEVVVLGLAETGQASFPTSASDGTLSFRYVEGSTRSNYNTPKITLDWTPLDGVNTYFSWARAQKPGGINQLTAGNEVPPFEAERFLPEKLTAWELGIKTGFEFRGFWQANFAGFFQDYTDKQVGIQVISEGGNAQPRVVNASGAEVWGLEFDLIWQPSFMDGLTLTFAGTLLDAEYTQWFDDTRNLIKVARKGECPLVWKAAGAPDNDPGTTDPNSPIAQTATSQVFCRMDYAGNGLERTPSQAYSFGMQLQRPFMDTEFDYLVELNGSWQDERWAEPENLTKLADYALLDIRLGLTSDRWDVIAYIDNVLDDDRVKTAGSGPDFGNQVVELGFTAGFGTNHYFVTMPDPRQFGIRASYRFGAGR